MMFWNRAALYERLESVCLGCEDGGANSADDAGAGADAEVAKEFPGLAAARCDRDEGDRERAIVGVV